MSDAPKSKQEKLAEKTASVIVGKDVDITTPLAARSIARKENRGRPSLAGAFAQAGITGMKNQFDDVTSTYSLPPDKVLLMIGNTDELKAVCELANETDPRINLIWTGDKEMQVR